MLNVQPALSRAKCSNERAEPPRVLCGEAPRTAGSQREVTAFPEGLGQCRGLSFLATSLPGRLVPSQQKLRGESGADKWCRQGSAEPCWRCPSLQPTRDIWVIQLREDSLLAGQEHCLGHTVCRVPCSGVGALQMPSDTPRPHEQAGWGCITRQTALIQALSYLKWPQPQPSARKTLHLTSTIRVARL